MLAATACALALAQRPAAARAEIAFAPCAATNDFGCGHLVVPLDPSGAVPGTVTLAIRRHLAPVGSARSAIVALAGGPGQSALPFAAQFDELLGPIASTRDLIVFDQRGIGLSDPLSCHAFEQSGLYRSFGALIEACGDQLGTDRSFYTTADTVADIEAIRQAGGYEKLVLYGTSYGTKVAERYAQEYPEHVEALVLDSVVPPNGPNTLNLATFAAVPRILRQLCEQRACTHVTAHPVADLARVLARMRRAPLRARALDGRGRAHTVTLSSDELLELLLAGDFSPLLRAQLLSAVAAAARGDDAPLARLAYAVASSPGEGGEEFDDPLYYATTCEEQEFPWNRASGAAARIAQVGAAARALGARAFAPFSAANAVDLSDARACAHWPYTTPAPAPDDTPLPDVPTLILSGAEDLRTPTSGAREVAAMIPDAQLLVVPHTGHSVLGTEPTACANHALQALFAAKAIRQCAKTPTTAGLRPPPLAPTRLGAVSTAAGYSGLAGRTLQAVALTLADAGRAFALALSLGDGGEGEPLPALRVGGLRSGWASLGDEGVALRDYSYVPGVTLSGAWGLAGAHLRVGGAGSAHGTLRSGPGDSLVGELGSTAVKLPAGAVATAAIVGGDAQESPQARTGGSAAGARVRQLAQLLERLRP